MGVGRWVNARLEERWVRGWIVAFALGVLLGVDIVFTRCLIRRYALLRP